jgi:regulator of PEP synthase PpsR (kinase-PPPase family)
MTQKFNLHLVSDSAGQTVSNVARTSLSQFSGVEANEFQWLMTRSMESLDKVLDKIHKKSGIVLYVLGDREMRKHLQQFCHKHNIPCIGAVGKVIKELSIALEVKPTNELEEYHGMDEGYFERMEAIDYTMRHDDGMVMDSLEEAEIILVGPSRTSKSPTCFYLGYNGYKAANIPFVPGHSLPEKLFSAKNALIVGLILKPERLLEIRKNRMLSLRHESQGDYTDEDTIIAEVREAKKLFNRYEWPIIDVTRKSIEETAASILKQLYKRKKKAIKKLLF